MAPLGSGLVGEVRVLLVEPSPSHRQAIAAHLQSAGGLRVLTMDRGAVTPFDAVAEVQPDVLILSVEPLASDPGKELRRIMASLPTPTLVIGESLVDNPRLAKDLEAMGALQVMNRPAAHDREYLPDWAASVAPLVRRFSRIKVVRILPSGDYPRAEVSRPADSTIRSDSARATSASAVRPALASTPLESSRGAGALRCPLRPPIGFYPRAVVVGASTGGPDALRRLLRSLPRDFSLPILIAQHMPGGFTRDLMSSIGTACPLPLVEVAEGLRPTGGVVYFIPAGHNAAFRTAGTISLSAPHERRDHTPSVSLLFQSSSAAYTDRLLAIILTGIGDDGAAGVRTVKAGGGVVVAQSQESCAVFGMPAAALATGCVDYSDTPEAIGEFVANLQSRRSTS
jgi:two-component system chemotaxis response regulator CheB